MAAFLSLKKRHSGGSEGTIRNPVTLAAKAYGKIFDGFPAEIVTGFRINFLSPYGEEKVLRNDVIVQD